ncbi:MAG: glutaredoxin [Clostridia bacterium]|uniref:protein disulfide oxidoreductase n=1 Tax=Proteiniclasticum sp. C24MP TaxID=3374101 RepID=UPI003754DCCC|nr:glutaredoxin [Clostridia bacterium]
MKMFNEEIQGQLKEIFQEMKGDVTIALFTKEGECPTCAETLAYMQEVEELSDKIHLEQYDINKDAELAKKYNVAMVPSIVMLDADKQYKGVKFNGIPAGHEINSFIPAILEVSGNESEMPAELEERIKKISKPINIKVFITLSCPHCPGAVQKAHKLALMNPFIEAEMIEAETFGELSMKHNVSGVPKIVINDEHDLLGNQPIQEFLNTIESIA